MNKPARPASASSHPKSDIHEIRRPAHVIDLAVPAMPFTGFPSTCESLSQMALEHLRQDEPVLARRAAEDSLLMIEQLAEGRRESDRATAANAALATGDAFLQLHEAHRAKNCFEIAARHFDRTNDLAHAAEARVGLAKALLTLRDPSARQILEDAGELFEDLGNDARAREIDLQLRQAQAEFECESPRSFHASSVTQLRVAAAKIQAS
jgi:hypothetical protein